MDSGHEVGSLVVRFISQDFAEAPAAALEVAEAAAQARNLALRTDIASSEAATTVDTVVISLDAIVKKLDIFVKVVDKASKVWASRVPIASR